MTLLLLWGGNSSERDVSEMSMKNMFKAAKEAGYLVEVYDPKNGDESLNRLVKNSDVVLLAMHGENGEDGVIQSKLEKLGAKYLGSDSLASAVAFDKVLTHKLLESNQITMPKYEVVNKSSFNSSSFINSKFVLKPIRGGSSLDTVVVRNAGDETALQKCRDCLKKYPEMIIEELIEGKEITVPVLGDAALPIVLTIPPVGEEFDFKNKYNGRSREIVPIPEEILSLEKQVELQSLALKVHEIIGARHISRVDIMLDSNDNPYVLEINTLPGMTKESFYPKSALAAGYTMPKLIDKLVELVKGD